MLVPWANSTGALIGTIAGGIMSGLVSYGGQYVAAANLVVPRQLPVSVDKCDEIYGIQVNLTTPVINLYFFRAFFALTKNFRYTQMNLGSFHYLGCRTTGLPL